MRSKFMVLFTMVLAGVMLAAFAGPAAAESKAVFSKLVVLPLEGIDDQVSDQALAAFWKEFNKSFTAMRTSVAALSQEDAAKAAEMVKKNFPKDLACCSPICQQKVLGESGANHVVSLALKKDKNGGYTVKAALLSQKKGLLQTKAKTGWDGKGKSGLIAAKRLAFRTYFNADKKGVEAKRAKLLKAIKLSEKDLKADTNVQVDPTKEKEIIDPMKKAKGDKAPAVEEEKVKTPKKGRTKDEPAKKEPKKGRKK